MGSLRTPLPASSALQHAHAHSALFLFRAPTLMLGRPLFLFLFAAHCATSARTHARTRAHVRPTTNEATCGPPLWLTGTLHGGGHEAYAHRLAPPPSLRPLSPRPCKAAAPKGPAFCFLNYTPWSCQPGAPPWAGRKGMAFTHSHHIARRGLVASTFHFAVAQLAPAVRSLK